MIPSHVQVCLNETVPDDPFDMYDVEERAAIMEYDGNTTREDAEEAAGLNEYRRICSIAAEYTRLHPKVTIVAATRGGGTNFFGVAIMGEARPRTFFDGPRGITRDELFGLFDKVTGVSDLLAEDPEMEAPASTGADDAWDW